MRDDRSSSNAILKVSSLRTLGWGRVQRCRFIPTFLSFLFFFNSFGEYGERNLINFKFAGFNRVENKNACNKKKIEIKKIIKNR